MVRLAFLRRQADISRNYLSAPRTYILEALVTKRDEMHDHELTTNLDALRNEALMAGALDPMSLLFSIVEYDKFSGERLSTPGDNLGFQEAVAKTAGLIEAHSDSHFCLQPVGFVQ
jgi:hypothetical protein